ncbi:hypothetical protein ACFS07_06395 [Undibacterium arcticum]
MLVPVFMLAAGIVNQAMAQDKATAAPLKEELTVLLDNDKVRVVEQRLKPGAESESRARPYRVVRALKGGTLQRIYLDGTKEIRQWKTGEVRVDESTDASYIVKKNIGKTETVLYVVNLK